MPEDQTKCKSNTKLQLFSTWLLKLLREWHVPSTGWVLGSEVNESMTGACVMSAYAYSGKTCQRCDIWEKFFIFSFYIFGSDSQICPINLILKYDGHEFKRNYHWTCHRINKSQNRGCYISHNPFSFNPPFLINKYLPKSSIVTRFLSIYMCIHSLKLKLKKCQQPQYRDSRVTFMSIICKCSITMSL